MRKLFLILIIVCIFMVTACSLNKTEDVLLLDEKSLYDMDMDRLESLREELYSGKTLSEILPNEKYNATLLDYYIEKHTVVNNTPIAVPNYAQYPLNQKIEADLDGDDRLETIMVTTTESGVKLRINDLETEYSGFTNLVDHFAIVDIDTNDKYKEVAISDYGPSNDDYTIYYHYDGKKIVFMNEGANQNRPVSEVMKPWNDDKIGGLFSYIECNGSGIITAKQRASILQTWWYSIKYKLTEGHLLQVEPEIFKVDYKVFVLNEIPLYLQRDDKSSTIIMQKGTIVRFTALDDIEWIQVTLSDGQTGWFKIKDVTAIVNGTQELQAADVFFCLDYAD